jgi:LysR family transcriptional regulator, glycine cleavage system transcriptional activator
MARNCPLNAVRAFVVAARCGSIKVGASQLCVTPGAISRQIHALEDYLGVPLFERGYRSVKLTDAGAIYFAKVGGALSAIDRASEDAGASRNRSVVKLDCIPTFAMHWLIPRLASFQNQHPDIEVAISTSIAPVERSGDFSLAIRRDPAQLNGLPSIKLMPEQIAPVASPGLKGLKAIRRPEQLAAHKLIYIRARPDLWPAWCDANRLSEANFKLRLHFDQTFFAIQAAEDGLGVALVPLLFVERLLATRRLVTLFATPRVVSGAYYLARREDSAKSTEQVFIDWLTGAAKGTGTKSRAGV